MKKLVISSLSQLGDLAKNKPNILNIPSFSVLKQILSEKKTCNCKKGKNLAIYRPQFEAAMAMLSPSDQNKLKIELGVDQLCYFYKDNMGQIKETCF